VTALVWAFLAPLPGLLLTALGVGRRPGTASLAGPLLVALAGLLFVLGDRAELTVQIHGFLPMLPDGAFALRLDGLAAAMLLVVGSVSTCVYVYSLSYLRGDPDQRRFFCLLDLFVLAMTLLVLAGNLVTLLAGWTGVGLASFLLIAFWRDQPHTLPAGLQAIAANAVGDAALLLACVLVPPGAGDLARLASVPDTALPGGTTLLAALLVTAAAAKSAQGILYFWLPSAMAGPTPVSALIHAATMVAAGVYLLVRTAPFLQLAPDVQAALAWLGVLTALCSAIASLWQRNYKRGLAYSTCSQLGYMFAAVGFGAPFAALFHLVTHAAFKALLFLCAGAVIHAAHGEEELDRLAGMRRALPQVALLALIGSLALCGLPVLTAGAFSKDLILEAGIERAPLLGWLLLAAVLLTGLYAGRLFFGVFGPAPRERAPGELHLPDRLLVWPMLPLAAGALLLGWAGAPLASLLGQPYAAQLLAPHLLSPSGLGAGALGLLGFCAAFLWQRAAAGEARLPMLGVDWVPRAAGVGRAMGRAVASLHNGRLGLYMFASVLGIGLILLMAIGRGA
jgi:NADH-quinone oxidoreductase subunit L